MAMRRFVWKREKKRGVPAGTLIHIGERKAEQVRISVLSYDETTLVEKECPTVEECLPFADGPAVTWLNVDGLHEPAVLQILGERLGIHPLVLEDILNTDQRPKTEDFGDYLFVVLKVFGGNNELEAEQLSLIVGPNYVVSFQERGGDAFDPIRERIRSGKGRLRKMGADYLAYSLLDVAVDNYFVVLEQVGEKIASLEDELVTDPNPEALQAIHVLKREMVFLRKSVWPLREVVGGLQRGESALIRDSTRIFLRDVHDHTIQVMDMIEAFRDLLSGMLDTYLSSISNRMNEVMKVLTIIGTIFIPLTFIAGVYGMNFEHMPELGWPWAYPMIWVVMVLISVALVFFFRRKRWL
jgi:magnesium transporter